MIPRQATGEWSVAASVADSTLECMAQRARWVHEGAEEAGRDQSEVELHTVVVRTIVGEDVDDAIATESADNGVPVTSMEDSTLYLTGSGSQIRDRLREWRAGTGLRYISIFDPGDDQVEYLAKEVVAPLRDG